MYSCYSFQCFRGAITFLPEAEGGVSVNLFWMIRGGRISVGQRGVQDFFRVNELGPEFFPVDKGGTKIFLRMQRGDQKNWRLAITKTGAPLPVKNDSSLNLHPSVIYLLAK